ncbi:MAG: protease [Deltaproteobacteria bacterium RBG_13_61_14]|nr:MAG: protease [Deltaproteobacteria bacterium RBG_13_61_14]
MSIKGKRVAILVEQLYQELEVWYPYYRLKEEGASVTVVGSGTAKEYPGKYGYPIAVDKNVDQVKPGDFDAVVIPGGYAPDHLRRFPRMVELVKKVYEQGGVIAAICHAGWMLASADIIRGVKCTSFFAIKDDMKNAGGKWEDSEVVVDQRIITSRKPDDLPAFCRELIKALG